MDAVKVLENHFGSDFYKLKKSDDLQYILSAMEEYANLKAREAAERAYGEGWDKSLTCPIAWKSDRRKNYIDKNYPLPQ